MSSNEEFITIIFAGVVEADGELELLESSPAPEDAIGTGVYLSVTEPLDNNGGCFEFEVTSTNRSISEIIYRISSHDVLFHGENANAQEKVDGTYKNDGTFHGPYNFGDEVPGNGFQVEGKLKCNSYKVNDRVKGILRIVYYTTDADDG